MQECSGLELTSALMFHRRGVFFTHRVLSNSVFSLVSTATNFLFANSLNYKNKKPNFVFFFCVRDIRKCQCYT